MRVPPVSAAGFTAPLRPPSTTISLALSALFVRVTIDSFASLYFVISRVFNAKMTPPGQAPDYLAEVNRIAAALPSFGDHAPLKLFLIEKEGR